MANKLSILSVGVVGVSPRLLFLETSAPESDVLQPGFINSIEQSSDIQLSQADYIFAVYEDGARREIFIPIFGPNNVITLQGIAGDSSAPGGITGAVNLGSGDGTFAGVSGQDLQFKSFLAGANIVLSPTGTDITISAISGGGGTIDDGLNLGTGLGVFAQASGSNLEFKSLVAGTNVTLGSNSNEIIINSSGGSGVQDGVNLGAGAGIFSSVVGTDMEFKSLIPGSNISFLTTGTDITISSTAGGSFEYEDTFWVSKNGSDSNDGKSIDSPKLTLVGAVAAFTTPTTPSVINIVDNGFYSGLFTTPTNNPGITINAPAAELDGIYIATGSTLNIIAREISPLGGNSIQVTSTATLVCQANYIAGDILSEGGDVSVKAILIDGDVTSQGGNFKIEFDKINGTITTEDTQLKVLGSDLSGTIVMTSTAPGLSIIEGTIGNLSSEPTFDADTEAFGMLGPNIYGAGSLNIHDQYIQRELSEIIDIISPPSNNFIPQPNQSGAKFLFDDNQNATCTLKTYASDPTFPVGYYFYVEQKQAGNVQFLSGDTIESVSNKRWTEGRGAIVRVDLMGTFVDVGPVTRYIWGLSGQVAGSASTTAVSGINVYVSALSGDDATGIGSLSQPYATIGAAITAAGAPANRVNIVIIDDETYDENVVIANANINLVGPTAALIATSGDALTITTTASQHLVNLAVLGASAGGANALNVTVDASVLVNVDSVNSGAVITVDGNLYIRSTLINSALTISGTGSINYITIAQAGILTPGLGSILGIDASGVPGNWEVLGDLSASGLDYPVTDAAAGYVITTDGAGTLSLQAPSLGLDGIHLYVSSLIGSDVTGDGSLTNPFASFGAAITAAGAPSSKTYIVGLDGEDYDEQLTVSNVLINIIAPFARLFSSAGDCLTVSASTGIMQFAFRDLASTFGGGNALNATANCTMYVNLDTNSAGNIQQLDGTMHLSAKGITGDLVIAGIGVGIINASTNQFSGGTIPAGGTINLITQSNVSGAWTVPGLLTASSIAYPTVDGNNGDVMTTNGLGTLTLAPPAGPSLLAPFDAIGGTSQAAVVNQGYVSDNAGLTTITLPAVFAVGDRVAVQGYGTAGWTLQASTGDVIHFFGVDTSAGGSLSSTARYDTVQVVGVVANSEWSVMYSGGAGLTVV